MKITKAQIHSITMTTTPPHPHWVVSVQDDACEHDWDRTIMLMSNPPRMRCNKCRTTQPFTAS